MESITDKDKDIPYGIVDLPQVSTPVRHVEKYWGNMTSIFEDGNFTVKRIFMKAGSQSSLEYHVKKREMYFIESGSLKVGVRIGRGTNKSVFLQKGDIFHIDPGLMHMRIAPEDVVIIEVSSRDDDGDSHIVEDGKKYKHIEVDD
tara:strand:+ start:20 stop:454 length:435 start_codon:yes stop_codon:yes gene_type:complete